jgi:type 1 glutamine amidotransferase
LKTEVALGVVMFMAACNVRESVGDLGASSGGSKSGGSLLPVAEAGAKAEGQAEGQAGAPAEAPTGEVGAGGASLAGPDEGTGVGGDSPSNPLEPYAPRSGAFKMVVYSRTEGFRHVSAIDAGTALLQQIADEQGFEVVVTEENAFLGDLENTELVFFLNTSGDVFEEADQQLFEAWMRRGGAFAGTHSATDTEQAWPFYSEIVGQHYSGHGPSGTPGNIELEASMLDHPALAGLPNPWSRVEEWFLFNEHAVWSSKPGFQILMRSSFAGQPYDGQPVAWVREWGNFRAFYTSLSHDAAAFQDPLFKQHLAGGIMWAARREHLLE